MFFGEGAPPEALSRHTGFLLNWVAARSRGEFARRLEPFGLRPPHFGVLSVIAHEPGLTQQELVERTSIDASSMVVLVDALEEQGLAERRPHPTDRRKRALHLTTRGEELVPRAQAAARATGEGVFGVLSKQELKTLQALLEKVAKGADDS